MKNKSALTDFYYQSLHPILKKLDEDRKHLAYRIILILSFITLMYGVILLIIYNHFTSNSEMAIFIAFSYIPLVIFLYKYLIKDYTAEFKDTIIRPLIEAIEPKLSYSSKNHVPQLLFNRSGIFEHPDKIDGNDFVKGSIDGINLQFSDINAQKRYKDSKGNESYKSIFQGLFFVAEFHKHFKSSTIILPDSAQKIFGNIIGNWLQANNFSKEKLVKMDDIAFEKEFVVYSSDQIEARYILSPVLMKKLLELKHRSQHPVYYSFVGGHIHIAINYNKDLFEPSVFKSLLKYKVAMEYVDTLHMAIGIVEELKLNQKLWSKV